jgi:hypothetical protein
VKNGPIDEDCQQSANIIYYQPTHFNFVDDCGASNHILMNMSSGAMGCNNSIQWAFASVNQIYYLAIENYEYKMIHPFAIIDYLEIAFLTCKQICMTYNVDLKPTAINGIYVPPTMIYDITIYLDPDNYFKNQSCYDYPSVWLIIIQSLSITFGPLNII